MSSAMDALEKLFTESLSTGLHSVLTDENEKAFEPGTMNLFVLCSGSRQELYHGGGGGSFLSQTNGVTCVSE